MVLQWVGPGLWRSRSLLIGIRYLPANAFLTHLSEIKLALLLNHTTSRPLPSWSRGNAISFGPFPNVRGFSDFCLSAVFLKSANSKNRYPLIFCRLNFDRNAKNFPDFNSRPDISPIQQLGCRISFLFPFFDLNGFGLCFIGLVNCLQSPCFKDFECIRFDN